jgi:hypothetical protein
MTLPPKRIIEDCCRRKIYDKAGVIAQFILAGYKQKTARARLRELEDLGLIDWENGRIYACWKFA